MISKQIATDIAVAHREIEAAELLSAQALAEAATSSPTVPEGGE